MDRHGLIVPHIAVGFFLVLLETFLQARVKSGAWRELKSLFRARTNEQLWSAHNIYSSKQGD